MITPSHKFENSLRSISREHCWGTCIKLEVTIKQPQSPYHYLQCLRCMLYYDKSPDFRVACNVDPEDVVMVSILLVYGRQTGLGQVCLPVA